MDKFQCKLNQNSYIFISENAFEKVVCKVAAVLSQPQCGNRAPAMCKFVGLLYWYKIGGASLRLNDFIKLVHHGIPYFLRSRHFLSLTLTRTSVHVSKMNVVARAHWTFKMLTLLQKYRYRQTQCSITWESKCLALIAQMVRAFGMNPMVGGSSPPQVEAFSVPKTFTLSQDYPFVRRKWMLLPVHS